MKGIFRSNALTFLIAAAAAACSSDDGGSGESTSPNTSGGTSTGGSSSRGGATSGGGTSASGDFLGSCDTRTVAGGSEGQCRDWHGEGGPNLSVSCNGLEGTYSGSEPCPSQDRIATCTLDPVLGTTAIYNYYAPTYDAAQASDECGQLEGTFRQEAATGSGGAPGSGGATNGGANSGGGSTSDCPPECFRPVQCVQSCGDEPQDYGCCPCPAGWIDTIQCG